MSNESQTPKTRAEMFLSYKTHHIFKNDFKRLNPKEIELALDFIEKNDTLSYGEFNCKLSDSPFMPGGEWFRKYVTNKLAFMNLVGNANVVTMVPRENKDWVALTAAKKAGNQ